MNLNDIGLESLNSLNYLIKDHFMEIKEKINISGEDAGKEITIYIDFLKKINRLGKYFSKNLFNYSANFQEKMKKEIKDEKLSQFFQLLINYMLKYSDQIRNKFTNFEKIIKNVITYEKDFKLNNKNNFEFINSKINDFELKIVDYNHSYTNYIRTYQKDYRNYLKEKKKKNFLPNSKLYQEMYFHEEKSLQKHSIIKKSIFSMSEKIKEKISWTTELENKMKNRMKDSTSNLIKLIFPQDNLLKDKILNLEDNLNKFNIKFEDILDDLSLDFEGTLQLSSHNIKFFDFSNYCRLNSIYKQKYTKFLFLRISETEKNIIPRVKIFTDMILQKIYCSNFVLEKDHLNQIHIILNNEKTNIFFTYNVILKKSHCRLEKPFINITLKKTQIKNLLQISQYFFLLLTNKKVINYELIYHYLKFSLTIFNKKGDCLCELLNKTFILHDVNFWLLMFDFLKKYIKNNPPESNLFSVGTFMSEINKKNFVGGLKNFVNVFKHNGDDKKIAENKAFEEISLLLFKCKLDFETISDVLLYLAPKAQIDFDQVRTILQKNEDLFQAQITDTRTFYSEYKKILREKKCFEKEKKIFIFLKNTLEFFGDLKDIYKVLTLNKKMWKNKNKIFNRILFRVKIKNKNLRKFLLKTNIDKNIKKEILLTDFKEEEKDTNNIISLDVKRTFNDKKNFNRKKLEKILRNISNPQMGGFSYYQGLNYITSYFLLLFEDNELDTYNLLTTILYKNFIPYVDKDLTGLKKLFFFLKRMMKLCLPDFTNYLENELKLDINIIFATWVLTLFTTTIQFFEKSFLLDEIIDIFVGKGWPGFFQIVLVIFDEFQDKVEGFSYEELLIVLTDLPKTNFVLIAKGKSGEMFEDGFSFKKKVRKFKYINNSQIAYFGGEYSLIMEKLEQFWFQLNKKVKKYNSLGN